MLSELPAVAAGLVKGRGSKSQIPQYWLHMSSTLCLNSGQVLNSELSGKYRTVEELIAKKTEESAEARRKAGMLQDEAKALLAQANSKLQLLKGKAVLRR